ncbi:MAG TPA: response regulator [Abditibacteriaceae bacterium]|jgi:DNA-binding NarL/FixJ family response regulator
MNIALKVLIVDDSIVIRERLVELMSGIETVAIVGQASGVNEALEMNHALRPDVIILDIHLPDGNGFDVLRALREQERQQRNKELVVIILTNYAQTPYREQAAQCGAQYFFDKSLEFRKVREVLENMLALGLATIAPITQRPDVIRRFQKCHT